METGAKGVVDRAVMRVRPLRNARKRDLLAVSHSGDRRQAR